MDEMTVVTMDASWVVSWVALTVVPWVGQTDASKAGHSAVYWAPCSAVCSVASKVALLADCEVCVGMNVDENV